MKLTKVCVITDTLEPEGGRTCFWSFLQPELNGIQIDPRSFYDCREKREFLDFREYDCLVFNWDVLNKDYWVHGEVVSAMTSRAARAFLPTWVSEGGLIILEAQCSHWEPLQEAYECAWPPLGFKVKGYHYYEAKAGTAYGVVKRHASHPFLKGFEISRDYTCEGNIHNRPWFPEWYMPHASIFDAVTARTHSGTFLTNQPEWLPLLYCKASRLPILLVCVYGKGAVVATTMNIASAGQKKLIRNIILNWRQKEDTDLKKTVRDYHMHAVAKERWRYYVAKYSGALIVSGGCLYLGLKYHSALAATAYGFGGFVTAGLLTSKYYGDIVNAIKFIRRRISQKIGSL